VSVAFDVVWSVLLIAAARAVAARVLAVPVPLVTALLSGLAGAAAGAGIQAAIAGEWSGAGSDVLFACSSAFAAVAVASVLSLLGAAPNVAFDAGAASLGPPHSPWRAVRDFLAGACCAAGPDLRMMAAALVNAASMSAKLMIVSGRLSKVSPTMLMTVAATSAFQTPGATTDSIAVPGTRRGGGGSPVSALQVALPRHIGYGRRYLLDPRHARRLDTNVRTMSRKG
jgi:hypothetical protein